MQTARKLIDKAYRLLGDKKHQLFSDTEMLDFLNEGYKELARKCKFTQSSTIYDFLPNNQSNYTLPQDLLELNFFVIDGENKPLVIERISPENYTDTNKIILTGMGEFIFKTDAHKQAVLTYWNEPRDLLITDAPPLIDALVRALVHYTVFRAYSIDKSTESKEDMQFHYAEYEKLARYTSNSAFTSLQQKPTITNYQGF